MGETIQKRLKSKVVHKHELEVNWLKSAYLPEQGEWVVYDVEVDADGVTLELPEGRTAPYLYQRMKMGDGVHNVNQLPFITAKEAEKLVGYDIATALIDSDEEIPTSNAVLDAIDTVKTDAANMAVAVLAEAQKGISEVREIAEQAYETAGTAYGDVQTVINTDLPDLDSRTINKVEAIDTWYDSVNELSSEDYGITWQDMFSFEYGGNEHTGTIYHRIPLIAGDNISFNVEEGVVRVSCNTYSKTEIEALIQQQIATILLNGEW